MKQDTPHTLSELQAWMQHALIYSGEDTPAEQIGQLVTPGPNLSPGERLAIYQRGYYARLIQCMETQFKALCHALGRELFDDFAREYLREYPSQSPTLAHLGTRLAAFLAATRPDTEEKEEWVEFMLCLAQFEWDLYTVFDLPGNEGKPYAMPETPDHRLVPQPCLKLHRYTFPVVGYYAGVAQGSDPQIPFPAVSCVAFCRKDFRTGIFSLLPIQFDFLEQICQGQTVESALRHVSITYNHSPEAIDVAWQEWKTQWTNNGFFALLTL